MERIYYNCKNSACFDDCLFMNDGTKVGSVACQECNANKKFDTVKKFIICKNGNPKKAE